MVINLNVVSRTSNHTGDFKRDTRNNNDKSLLTEVQTDGCEARAKQFKITQDIKKQQTVELSHTEV